MKHEKEKKNSVCVDLHIFRQYKKRNPEEHTYVVSCNHYLHYQSNKNRNELVVSHRGGFRRKLDV